MLSPDVPLLVEKLGKYIISVSDRIGEQHNDHTVNKAGAGNGPGKPDQCVAIKKLQLLSPHTPSFITSDGCQ